METSVFPPPSLLNLTDTHGQLRPTTAIKSTSISPHPTFSVMLSSIYGHPTLIATGLSLGLAIFATVLWLVYYYSNQCFYRHNKAFYSSRLYNAVQTALDSIPMRKLVQGDVELAEDFYQCAVCLEEFRVHDVIRSLPCRHTFHCKCVDQWLLRQQQTCPVCKQDLLLAMNLYTSSMFHEPELDPLYPLLWPSTSTSSSPRHLEVALRGLEAMEMMQHQPPPVTTHMSNEVSLVVDVPLEHPQTPWNGGYCDKCHGVRSVSATSPQADQQPRSRAAKRRRLSSSSSPAVTPRFSTSITPNNRLAFLRPAPHTHHRHELETASFPRRMLNWIRGKVYSWRIRQAIATHHQQRRRRARRESSQEWNRASHEKLEYVVELNSWLEQRCSWSGPVEEEGTATVTSPPLASVSSQSHSSPRGAMNNSKTVPKVGKKRKAQDEDQTPCWSPVNLLARTQHRSDSQVHRTTSGDGVARPSSRWHSLPGNVNLLNTSSTSSPNATVNNFSDPPVASPVLGPHQIVCRIHRFMVTAPSSSSSSHSQEETSDSAQSSLYAAGIRRCQCGN